MRTTEWVKIKELSDTNLWKDSICITIDIDWANDDVLADTITLLEKFSVPVTWFVTHETPLLDRLRSNPNFELGIHPNFNAKLHNKDNRSIENIIDELLWLVPEAQSVRSHSLVQSSRLIEIFSNKKLKFECNTIVPFSSNIELRPWYLWNGILKVPHLWEDDVACLYGLDDKITQLLLMSGLKVFAFHPIHIFLNTEDLSRYETSRHIHNDIDKLIHCRCRTYGTRNALLDLLNCKKNDI